MQSLGIHIDKIKVGNDNLFQSNIFSSTITNLINAQIEVVKTTGATGAARASGCAIGSFNSIREAMGMNEIAANYYPDNPTEKLQEAYQSWCESVTNLLN